MIETIRYNVLSQNHTISSYSKYLEEYPNGIYAKEAKKVKERIRYGELSNINTVSSLSKYLNEYPNGLYADYVKKRIIIIKSLKFYFDAASKGKWLEIKKNLNIGVDINSKDATGKTALMYAASNGKEKLVKKLIYNGADPDIKDEFGYSAYTYAISNKYKKTGDYIRKYSKNIDEGFFIDGIPLSSNNAWDIMIFSPEQQTGTYINEKRIIFGKITHGWVDRPYYKFFNIYKRYYIIHSALN